MNLWTRIITKKPRFVVLFGVILTVTAAVYGLTVFDKLSSGGFDDPATSSYQARSIIAERFRDQRADVIVMFTGSEGVVTGGATAERIKSQLETIRTTAGVEGVTSFYATGAPNLVSQDQKQTFATVRLTGNQAAQTKTYQELERSVASSGGVAVDYGGVIAINNQISTQISKDLAKAEALSFPILAVLLIIVFRSVVAALVPLALGGLSILVAFLLVRVLTNFTDVSIYAINIITLMGLGLAIDYSLFIVSRFREELAAGKEVPAAIQATLGTAGRTVLFSALTVILCLLGLLVFPQNFLRSMGLGGAAAVAATAILSLTVLPAVLRLLGKNINALALPGLRKKLAKPAEHGMWYKYSHFIMRHPLASLAVALELLALMALPFLAPKFSTPDASTVPEAYSSRQVYEQLNANFSGGGQATITLAVKADGAVSEASNQAKLTSYLDELRTLDGINSARIAASSGEFSYVVLDEAYASQGSAAQQTVREVRAVAVPAGWSVESGGQTAELVDLLSRLSARIPIAGLIILVTTSVLMFLMLGSIVMPLKAILLNIISLSAAFGVLAWIFQDGNLTGTLGLVSNGTLDATQPILIFAIAFGLAMDYELFLLSRIKEAYDRTGDNAAAVAMGIEHTAGIITSAALMLVVVIGLFATGQISIIQQVGIGLAAAVAIDATIVRMVLVPSAMKLLGTYNWWAPAPLAAIAKRLGLRESAS